MRNLLKKYESCRLVNSKYFELQLSTGIHEANPDEKRSMEKIKIMTCVFRLEKECLFKDTHGWIRGQITALKSFR
jgi:hypothetical protein